jgi:hypothetical protein
MVVILAPLTLVLGLVVAFAGPASAHPGIIQPYVPAGRMVTLILGVPSEEPSPMVGIDVALPEGFTLQRLDQTPGWQAASSPGFLHFSGGNAPQGTYVQFSFAGTFAVKEEVALDVAIHTASGTVRDWNGGANDAYPAPVVFAGFAAPKTVAGAPTSTGHQVVTWGVRFLVVAAGVALVTVYVLRRRRLRPSVGS